MRGFAAAPEAGIGVGEIHCVLAVAGLSDGEMPLSSGRGMPEVDASLRRVRRGSRKPGYAENRVRGRSVMGIGGVTR